MTDSIGEIIIAIAAIALVFVWIMATNNAFGSASIWLVYLIPAFIGMVVTIGHDRI